MITAQIQLINSQTSEVIEDGEMQFASYDELNTYVDTQLDLPSTLINLVSLQEQV